MGSHLPVQQLEHLDVELSRLRARSNPEVSVWITLDDLHGGDLAVSAEVGVRDVDDGELWFEIFPHIFVFHTSQCFKAV